MKYKTLITAMFVISANVNSATIPGINTSGGGSIMPKGKLKVVYKNVSMKRNKIFNGSSEVANTKQLNAKANMNLLALKYGIGDNADLTFIVPYKDFSASAKLGANNVEVDNQGLGDVVIMANKGFANLKEDGHLLSAGIGIKFPTGDTDKKFVTAPAMVGEYSPLPSQPGTEAYEYKLMGGYTKFLDDIRFDANVAYTIRPKAKNNYDFGNETKLDLSFVKPVAETLNLGVGYSFKHNQETNRGDDTTAVARANLVMKAFSGTAGYITPQIQWLPFGKPKIHIDLGVSYLVHYDVKEEQPLEKKRLVLRFGYLF